MCNIQVHVAYEKQQNLKKMNPTNSAIQKLSVIIIIIQLGKNASTRLACMWNHIIQLFDLIFLLEKMFSQRAASHEDVFFTRGSSGCTFALHESTPASHPFDCTSLSCQQSSKHWTLRKRNKTAQPKPERILRQQFPLLAPVGSLSSNSLRMRVSCVGSFHF